MYQVSEGYKNALRKNVVSDRIAGSITLSDNTYMVLSDSMLVKNSLKLTGELCGEYAIGTFNLSCLEMTVFDGDALHHDFSGAEIRPVYQLDNGKSWENIPLGVFTVDGGSVKRKRDTVSFTAYDNGILFDSVIPEDKRAYTGNAEYFIQLACSECDVFMNELPERLPNKDVMLSLKNPQVQTYRDLVAWCALLLCAYAVIDREGNLKIIPAKYSVDENSSSDIIVNKSLAENERFGIYATDTRAYIRRLNAYCGNKIKAYVSNATQSDEQAAEAVYTMPAVPLLPKLTEARYDAIYREWLGYIDSFKQRGITAKIYGDPSIDLGDAVCCSGGDIDQRGSIIGVITKQEWRYRNFHSIVCSAPELFSNISKKPANVINQYEKKTLSGGAGYTAGDGIFISDEDVISVKAPDSANEKRGGVYLANSGNNTGLSIDGEGAVRGIQTNVGKLGMIDIGDGLEYHYYSDGSRGGSTGVRLGKGLGFVANDETSDYTEIMKNVKYRGRRIQPRLGEGLEFDADGAIAVKSGNIIGTAANIFKDDPIEIDLAASNLGLSGSAVFRQLIGAESLIRRINGLWYELAYYQVYSPRSGHTWAWSPDYQHSSGILSEGVSLVLNYLPNMSARLADGTGRSISEGLYLNITKAETFGPFIDERFISLYIYKLRTEGEAQ